MNFKKALKELRKGKRITNASWSKDIYLREVIGQFMIQDGKEKPLGAKEVSYFEEYFDGYDHPGNRALSDKWEYWEEPKEHKEMRDELKRLHSEREEIDKRIKFINQEIN